MKFEQNLFNDTEVHRLVGAMFLWTGSSGEVTLGDRILDTATKTARDVDVVYVSTKHTVMSGVEVKDHKKPLDTPIVEQLAVKLADMSFDNKYIVSSSGFTKHALKKARAHGVDCISIKEGPLPEYTHVDLSSFKQWSESVVKINNISIIFIPDDVSLQSNEEMRYSAVAYLNKRDNPLWIGNEQCSVQILSERITRNYIEKIKLQNRTGTILFDDVIPLDRSVNIPLTDEMVSCTKVQLYGELFIDIVNHPINSALHLFNESTGKSIAASALIIVDRHLLGLGASSAGNTLNLFNIPSALRVKRPNQEKIEPTQ